MLYSIVTCFSFLKKIGNIVTLDNRNMIKQNNDVYNKNNSQNYSLHTQVFEYNSISGRINSVRLISDRVLFLFLAHTVIL